MLQPTSYELGNKDNCTYEQVIKTKYEGQRTREVSVANDLLIAIMSSLTLLLVITDSHSSKVKVGFFKRQSLFSDFDHNLNFPPKPERMIAFTGSNI